MPDPIVYPGQTIKTDAINGLVQPHVQVTSSFSVPGGTTGYAAATFTTVLSSNTPSMWSTGQATRLIAPTAGVYLLHGGLIWTGALGTADGRGEIRANGSGVPAPGSRVGTQRGSTGNMQSTISGTVTLAANGYIEIYLNTTAPGAVAVGTTLGITRISAT